jgi:hypothetical protein
MKRAWKAVLAGLFVAAIASPALAAPSLPTEGFEGFTVGTSLDPTGTNWTYSGGTKYDIGVVGSGIDGGRSVRISNAVMSGSFGDWLFSPAIDPATETENQEFTAEFDIKSASGQYQQGLQTSVAPQTAGGARMSFVKFTDTPGGIVVSFADVLNLSETVDGDATQEVWREVNIATLNYTDTYHVKIVMNLIDGPHNDVVQVYIDDMATGLVPGRPAETQFDGFYAPVDNQPTINKAKAGQTIPMKWTLNAKSFATSWEDYYRYNSESNAGLDPEDWTTRQVDSLIFQARCAPDDPDQTCANENLGTVDDADGYLIDNVSYVTSDTLGLPVALQGVSDPAAYGIPVFTTSGANASECAPTDGYLDPIETYTSNAGGLMYHGNGVWQYNWQTPKSNAGKCVEMTLNLSGDSTLFKFTK